MSVSHPFRSHLMPAQDQFLNIFTAILVCSIYCHYQSSGYLILNYRPLLFKDSQDTYVLTFILGYAMPDELCQPPGTSPEAHAEVALETLVEGVGGGGK